MQPLFAFIGGGNMGQAIIGGLISAGHSASRIRVSDKLQDSRSRCAEAFNVATFADNLSAVEGADVVILAVKPQQMREVAERLTGGARPGPVFISIAAGVPIGQLESWLGADAAVVRCMPNTPALVQAGAAALCANRNVTSAQRAQSAQILEAVGIAVWLEDEAQMDAVTALSGSGPAYFFLLLELLEEGAAELGLPRDIARRLAVQTAYGAASLAKHASTDPATLRRQVTSPGGTTERALASFEADGLKEVVARALAAAYRRSQELAQPG